MSSSANDLVFVFPPGHQAGTGFENHLGVAYLRASLERSGIESRQYLNPRPGTIREVALDLLSLKPRVVGFTAYDTNFPLCLSLMRSLQQLQPEVTTVVGGPTVTFQWQELMSRHSAIDVCVLSEAEETGPAILGKLLAGEMPDEHQPGVAFRRDGQIVRTPEAPLVGITASSLDGALDTTPSPYLSGMLQDGRTGVLTGRGCTHHCQYCGFAAIARRTLRLHSAERVVAELEWIAAEQKRSGHRYQVAVEDDAFTLFPARAAKVCEEIIQRNLKLRLSCATRGDAVDFELLKLMRAAGFMNIAFGLESAVPSVLRAVGKVRPPNWPQADLTPERQFIEKVREGVLAAKELGFAVGVSIILGLPTETAADAEATLRFIDALPVDYYAHNLLALRPGTALWDNQPSNGISCSLNSIGIPDKTRCAYDVTEVAPAPKSHFEKDAESIRNAAADAIDACDVPLTAKDSIHTIVIRAEELVLETARWMRDILEIGGVVVQCYPRLHEQEYDDALARDRRVLRDHLVPVSYYLQLQPRGRSAESGDCVIRCMNFDVYSRHYPDRITVKVAGSCLPMLRWLQNLSWDCDSSDVTAELLRSGELAELARRIDDSDGSSPLRDMPFPPRIQYCGRWVKGSSSCRSFNRLEVDEQGTVRCCRFGEPIGRVGDPKEKLKARLASLSQAVEEKRGCASCSTPDCPKCPFPGVDDDSYCATVKQCTAALKALDWIHMYSGFLSLLSGSSSG